MHNSSFKLERLATWRNFWILLVAEATLLCSVNLLDFPLSVPSMIRLTGHRYLDMCAFCSAPHIYQELTGFGALGRHYQLLLMVTIDIAIPVTSLMFGIVGLKVLLRPGEWNALLAAPAVAFVLDLLENAGILWVTNDYPVRNDSIATFVGTASGLKFCAYALTLVLIASLGVKRCYWAVVLRRH